MENIRQTKGRQKSIKALTDVALENNKNAGISHIIKSLKAYSDTGDNKQLMDLPKEIRSLILDKQSEQTIND